MSILLKNVRIIDSENCKDIYISDGIIKKIGENLDISAENNVIDDVIDGNGTLTVIPALFDMHVHFRDPGQTHKEDILTGCKAALAGGVTGVVCMPNTNPPVDNPETVQYIIKKAEGTGVKVYPAGCMTKGMNGGELCCYKELGVKLVSDDGRPVENAELMKKALLQAEENGILAASHCEDLKIIDGGIINKGKISEKLGVKGMDRASEDNITEREIAIAKETGTRVHICHVSTRKSFDLIRKAKAEGVKVTCETCPHYFTLTEEKLLTRDADYRMNPPLRTEDDRFAVVEAVLDGTVDCIVTDHAPHTKEEKADFLTAPNGVTGLETSLAVTLTAFYHTKKLSLQKIVELMSVNPRKLLGLEIPEIKEGAPAELAVIDLEAEWLVDPEKMHSKSRNTAFKGEKLKGRNICTIANGEIRFKVSS